MENEIIIEVCNTSNSMKEACEKLNMKFSTFKRKAIKLGCYKTNQFWSRGKTRFSDNRIKSKYKHDEVFIENSQVSRDQIKNIIIKEKLLDYYCSECGLKEVWNNKLINLQLDHKNGIRNDNRIQNLRFLCPNCHSQTESFCKKNINSKTIDSYDIKEVIKILLLSRSITDAILKLGIYDNTKNRNKLKIIKENNNIIFMSK